MPRKSSTKELGPLNLSAEQVQELYLEVQHRLGMLLRAAPREKQSSLAHISEELLRVKRAWIGVSYDALEDKIFVALER